jgi:hypothetical protein
MTTDRILAIAREAKELAGKATKGPMRAIRTTGPTGGGNVYWRVESWSEDLLVMNTRGRPIAGQRIASIDHWSSEDSGNANLFAHAGTHYATLAEGYEKAHSALRKCAGVMSGALMSKSALVEALEAIKDAIGPLEESPS